VLVIKEEIDLRRCRRRRRRDSARHAALRSADSNGPKLPAIAWTRAKVVEISCPNPRW
jgi:hypothetical protein